MIGLVHAGVKILFAVGGTTVVRYGDTSKFLVKGHGWRGVQPKKDPVLITELSVDTVEAQPQETWADESTNGSVETGNTESNQVAKSSEQSRARVLAGVLAEQAEKMAITPNGPWICSTCLKELSTIAGFEVWFKSRLCDLVCFYKSYISYPCCLWDFINIVDQQRKCDKLAPRN